jgi:hypothetical protein
VEKRTGVAFHTLTDQPIATGGGHGIVRKFTIGAITAAAEKKSTDRWGAKGAGREATAATTTHRDRQHR